MFGNRNLFCLGGCFRSLGLALLVVGLLAGCDRFQSAETQIEKANAALEKSDKAAAIIYLKNALQKDANNGRARYMLGKAYLDNGSHKDAIKELQRALDLKFDANLVLPLLAKSALQSGEFKILEQLDPQLAGDASARAEVLASQGDGLLYQKKTKEAEIQYNEAIKLNPNAISAHFGLARLAAMTGGFQAADEIAADISKRAPKNIEILLFRANLRTVRGELRSALEFTKQAGDVDPKDVRPHIMATEILLALKESDQALKEMETVKSLAPKSPLGPYLNARIHVQNGKGKEAQAEVQKALKLAPNYWPALMLAAQIEISLGNAAQAEPYLKQAGDMAPGSASVRRLTAVIYMRSGRASAAVDLLKPLLEQNPEDPELNAIMGEAYLLLGEMEQANKHLARAAKSDRLARGALTGLAVTSMAGGDPERAMAQLEQATHAQGTSIQADLILIGALTQKQEFDKAHKAIDALEKKIPGSPVPYSLRAGIGVAKKDMAYARAMLEKALQLDPNYFFAVNVLARMDKADGKGPEALKRLEDYVKKNDKDTAGLLALAELKLQLGASPEDVLGVLQRAQASDPKKIRTSAILARYLMSLGKAREAMEAVQTGLATSPDAPELIDVQGGINMSQGKTADAVANFTRLTILQPRSPVAWAKLAQVQNAAGDKQAAIASVEQARALNPQDMSLMEMAISLRLTNKNYSEALALAQKAQKDYPKSSFGYVQEANIRATQKQYKEAVDSYDRALGTEPLSATFVLKLHALELAGRQDDADKALDVWLKRNPKDIVALTYAGEVQLSKKNYDRAIAYYKTALELQANNLPALNNLAWLLNEKRDPAALSYADSALKLQPKQPAALDTRGMIYLRLGKTAEAVNDLKAAVDYAPNNAAIHLNYARALLKAGKRDEAKRELEILRKLGAAGAKEVEALAQELG
ncbi:MAG: PEP-CTERM system TPR-repeat protein PrsT [Burkholderiaceae bacterium]|nr:MAG: PEP-CTERM system TPR-repeat protein PrsT [Burkholderiaceae bacterium]